MSKTRFLCDKYLNLVQWSEYSHPNTRTHARTHAQTHTHTQTQFCKNLRCSHVQRKYVDKDRR